MENPTQTTMEKTYQPPREIGLYFKTSVFSLIVFGLSYAYISWLQLPSELNKSVADTAIILMGASMILSSICYFFNALDKMIIYRKYLGLVGFAYAVAHLILSWNAFMSLFKIATWQTDRVWPVFAGLLATIIFTVMALISNTYAAGKLGGRRWKFILRTGYLAVIFVAVHVGLLRLPRWISWFQEGMQTPPSLSLLVTLFMVLVVLMRIVLWWSVSRKRTVPPTINSAPVTNNDGAQNSTQ